MGRTGSDYSSLGQIASDHGLHFPDVESAAKAERFAFRLNKLAYYDRAAVRRIVDAARRPQQQRRARAGAGGR